MTANVTNANSPEPSPWRQSLRRCVVVKWFPSGAMVSHLCSISGTSLLRHAFNQSNICGGLSCSQSILRPDWSRLRFFRPPLWLRLRLRSKDPAPAQSSSTPRAETPAKPVQEQSANEWRASKVIGLYVYNDANERLGSINEVLMDSSGKINKAVIGVGGFLGIGESNIALNFDQLKFVNEPMRTATTHAGGAGDRPGQRQVEHGRHDRDDARTTAREAEHQS